MHESLRSRLELIFLGRGLWHSQASVSHAAQIAIVHKSFTAFTCCFYTHASKCRPLFSHVRCVRLCWVHRLLHRLSQDRRVLEVTVRSIVRMHGQPVCASRRNGPDAVVVYHKRHRVHQQFVLQILHFLVTSEPVHGGCTHSNLRGICCWLSLSQSMPFNPAQTCSYRVYMRKCVCSSLGWYNWHSHSGRSHCGHHSPHPDLGDCTRG